MSLEKKLGKKVFAWISENAEAVKAFAKEKMKDDDKVSKGDFALIIGQLNTKTGKRYNHRIAKTRDLIRARYAQGFRLEDFLYVINNKVEQWLNSEMEIYLRPETLFGNRFEGYRNEQKQFIEEKKSEEPIPFSFAWYEQEANKNNASPN